jgi:hypothetical protein
MDNLSVRTSSITNHCQMFLLITVIKVDISIPNSLLSDDIIIIILLLLLIIIILSPPLLSLLASLMFPFLSGFSIR